MNSVALLCYAAQLCRQSNCFIIRWCNSSVFRSTVKWHSTLWDNTGLRDHGAVCWAWRWLGLYSPDKKLEHILSLFATKTKQNQTICVSVLCNVDAGSRWALKASALQPRGLGWTRDPVCRLRLVGAFNWNQAVSRRSIYAHTSCRMYV